MTRKTAPFWIPLVLLFAGCDFFTTQDFVPKPPKVSPLQGLLHPGDSLSFSLTESLRNPGSAVVIQTLAGKRLRFLCLGDSLRNGDTLKVVALRVTDSASGATQEEDTGLVDFNGEGFFVETSPAVSGRYFSLKVAATAADSGTFQALPGFPELGQSWLQTMGIFNVTREVAGVETVAYRGRLEESWRVAEIVVNGSRTMVRGNYWYGASGLLKSEQVWPSFGRRGTGGADSGAAEIHRELRRL